MHKSIIILLIILPLCVYAAERIVLLEDFTNDQGSPSWSFEPTLNSIVNSHLAVDEISVIRYHVNWPGATDPIYLANPSDLNIRKGFYMVSSIPNFKVDGESVSPDSAVMQNLINSRLAVPSYLEIFVARNGGAETGTVSIGLIAEQDLMASDSLLLNCILVENDVPGSGMWGSTVFKQAFRDDLFGWPETVFEFSGPYPDTMYFEADYDITGWVNDNLYLATFVQVHSTSDKEVMNASFSKFIDLPTGIEGGTPASGAPLLTVGPNPSGGLFSISAEFGGSSPATVSVFDITGRRVVSEDVMPGGSTSFDIGASGLYFVRMTTLEGLSVTESLAVIR